MRAAVFKKLHQPLQVELLPDPVPGEGQVLINVHRCGICGSDLHMAEEAAFGLQPESILGHEFAGEVVDLGRGNERLKKGDLVSVVPLRGCGRCVSCLIGEPAWCTAGMQLQGGGYGELAVANELQFVVMPKSLSFTDGAIVEPLAVALHGISLSGLQPSDKVVIIGAGPIGLAAAFWARRYGASKVLVLDISSFPEQRAMKMGATDFLAGSLDPVGDVDRILGGKADVVFECVGAPGLIAQSIEHVRTKGTVVVLGLCAKADSFVPFTAISKEARIQTSAFFTHQEYHMALAVLDSGAAEPRYLVTDTVPLDKAPEAFESLKRRGDQCKVIIATQ